jgi:hypothetical protein
MSEVQLTYSKLVQIARGLALRVFDGSLLQTFDIESGEYKLLEYILYREFNMTFPIVVAPLDDGSHLDRTLSELGLVAGMSSAVYYRGERYDTLSDLEDALPTEQEGTYFLSYDSLADKATDYDNVEEYNTFKRAYNLLFTLGYLKRHNTTNGRIEITSKSLLLTDSSPSNKIFISYRRNESCLLALYLQSRLKIAGGEAFVDVNNLTLGDDWHPALENKVKTSAYFICLVGPETLDSKYVRQEIDWAIKRNVKIIPVFHNGFDAESRVNKLLVEEHPFLERITQKHGHVIKDAGDPNDYRNAADEILTSLGYAVL